MYHLSQGNSSIDKVLKMASNNVLSKSKIVMVWGTFDALHKGHIEFLRHAKSLVGESGELYVIVVPDNIVQKNKGRFPYENEAKRKSNLEKLDCVDKVFIDSFEQNALVKIEKIRPDIFCFGYDQTTIWEDKLVKYLMKMGATTKVVRLRKYADGIHSSQIKTFLKTKINKKYMGYISR